MKITNFRRYVLMENVIRNEVEIDLNVINRIKQKILFEEEINCRTHATDDSTMIKRDMKILEDEVNAY